MRHDSISVTQHCLRPDLNVTIVRNVATDRRQVWKGTDGFMVGVLRALSVRCQVLVGKLTVGQLVTKPIALIRTRSFFARIRH
jgi:hypothetical protein